MRADAQRPKAVNALPNANRKSFALKDGVCMLPYITEQRSGETALARLVLVLQH
jgi:hypothetical protein